MIDVLEAEKRLERPFELTPDGLYQATLLVTNDPKKASLAKANAILAEMKKKQGIE